MMYSSMDRRTASLSANNFLNVEHGCSKAIITNRKWVGIHSAEGYFHRLHLHRYFEALNNDDSKVLYRVFAKERNNRIVNLNEFMNVQ